MVKNYLSETDLQSYLYEKDQFLWTGETDLSGKKSEAEQVVMIDLITSDYKPLALRPDLMLRSSTDTISSSSTGTSYEDTASRLRLAYNVTVRTGTTSLVLQGSNDNLTWTTVYTKSVTATGEGSFVFVNAFRYYRINSTITAGTLAFTAWLTETIFDQFFKYKWLEIILMSAGKGNPDSKFTQYGLWFNQLYKELLDKKVLQIDEDGDGTIDDTDTGELRFGR